MVDERFSGTFDIWVNGLMDRRTEKSKAKRTDGQADEITNEQVDQ